jgi:hypothetical protein
VVEIEPVNRKAHFLRERIVLLLRWDLGRHPVLQLRLAHDTIAVQLVPAAYERVERLLGVLLQEIDPDRVVPALEAWPTEVVWIDACTKPVTLSMEKAGEVTA